MAKFTSKTWEAAALGCPVFFGGEPSAYCTVVVDFRR